MKPLQRKRLVDDAAELLTKEIQKGQIIEKLPSSRNLASLLGISRPKILEALRELENKGIIEQKGPKRTYWVAAGHAAPSVRPAKAKSEKQALFILEERSIQNEAFEMLMMLAAKVQPKGWKFHTLCMSFGHNESRPRQWKRAIEGCMPDKVIVLAGRPRLSEWLFKSGIPAIFIGGDRGNTPIPVVGMRSQQAVEKILDVFFDAGHERIWFPFCNRSQAYADTLRRFVANAFHQRGIEYLEPWHTPSSPYRNAQSLLEMFEEAWQHFRPTALLFHDWREYLAVSSILRREGLDIPSHMSVALIGDDADMAWHQPEMAHFVRPLTRIAGACAAWLSARQPTNDNRIMTFKAEWNPGASIGPPRDS